MKKKFFFNSFISNNIPMLPAVLSGALERKKEPIPPHQIYMTFEYASGWHIKQDKDKIYGIILHRTFLIK